MDFLAVLLLIVVIIGGFVVVPAWFSRATGMSIKSKHGGTVARPDDFDKMKTESKKILRDSKKEISSKKDLISKKIKGTYKYLFDKIESTKLADKDETKSLGHFMRLKKSIEMQKIKIDSEHNKTYLPESFKSNHPDYDMYVQFIKKYNEYISYVNEVDFKQYIALLSKIFNVENDKATLFIDKIGIENSNLVFGLLKEIDSAFWRNDLREDEALKLNQVITNKLVNHF